MLVDADVLRRAMYEIDTDKRSRLVIDGKEFVPDPFKVAIALAAFEKWEDKRRKLAKFLRECSEDQEDAAIDAIHALVPEGETLRDNLRKEMLGYKTHPIGIRAVRRRSSAPRRPKNVP